MILTKEANKEGFNSTMIYANAIANATINTEEADKLKANLIALDLQNQEDIVCCLARSYILDMFKENSDDFS